MTKQRPPSRVWLEVSLKAIGRNFRRIQKSVRPNQVMAVLKANAYGLGAGPIAEELYELGANRFGVAELKEAIALKKKFKLPIQILSGMLESEVDECVRQGIVCPVGDVRIAKALSRAAVRQRKRVKVHFKIDTGMGRLGFPHFQAAETIRKISSLPGLEPEGILSHFSNANNPKHNKSQEQLGLFLAVLGELNSSGLDFPLVHMANSDAINNLTDAQKKPFNLVRTGINLYGVFDLEGGRSYRLEPSLQLKSSLLGKRLLPAGYTIGYGCTHTLFRDTWVGTVPTGYADGIPLSSSNSGSILIRGRLCPIIGRVSMDYITVDLSTCPEAREGDTVIIVGKSGAEQITIEDWAKIKQTHPYDVICGLGNRIQRVYV